MEEKKKKTIAAIGDEDFTLGFKLAGVQKVFDGEDYGDKMRELLDRDDIGIVAAERADIEQLPEKLRKDVEQSVDPVVVALSEESGISGLEQKIRNVIGIDIS